MSKNEGSIMKNPTRSRNELSQQGARTARTAERADIERVHAPTWSPSHGLAGGAPTGGRQRRPSLNRALQELLRQHNDRHAVKPKGVSFKTREERANAVFRCFRDLHALGYRIKNPYCLGGRHIEVLVEDWTAAHPRSREHTLSPATIQTELSHLRTFACWIRKAGLVRRAEAYVSDPRLVTRRYVATKDKAWSAQGLDPDALIRTVEAHDVWVGAQLRVARAFGLRVKEAVMPTPPARPIRVPVSRSIAARRADVYGTSRSTPLRSAKRSRPRGDSSLAKATSSPIRAAASSRTSTGSTTS
jgi:hypothetical protein